MNESSVRILTITKEIRYKYFDVSLYLDDLIYFICFRHES